MSALMHLTARTPEGVQLVAFQHGGCNATETYDSQRIEYSTDGTFSVRIGKDNLEVVQPGRTVKIDEPAVVFVSFSSTATYLVTCQRPSKDESGQGAKNLKVWSLVDGSCVLALSQKQANKENWPAVQWTSDDSNAVHMVTNTLHVYSRADNFASARKVTIKGVSGFAVCPAPGVQRVAAFIPEAKGSPASAGIYDLGSAEPAASVKKSFYRCQGANLMWNAKGSACLVLSFADFDVTNQSYYGEQKLYYLPADPAKADLACAVPLPKEGPVHDVQWSPVGDYFLTVAGFMPAKVTLFDTNCKPVYDLGSGPYNIARWNPFGRFFVIAGFGNLPGDIIFYDKKTSGTCKPIASVRSPAVTAQWSPDGRHLMTATTAPRLRVDNNVRVFTYYGEQQAHMPFPTLFEAAWLPVAPGTYQDRPQSPERLAAAATSPSGESASATPVLARPAGYVPPHLRNSGGGGATVGATFSLAHDPNDKAGKIKSGGSAVAPFTSSAAAAAARLPPGAEFVNPKAASKNARKRSNKKKGPGGDDDGGDDNGADDNGVEAAQQDMQQLSVQQQQQQGGGAPSSDEERQKRIRNLQKKLRQIGELKEKMAAQGAQALEPEQLKKVESEAALLAELQSLGGSM